MTYQARLYIHGAVAAAIAGGANAVTLIIVDPLKFNLLDWAGTRSLIVAVAVSAIVGFAGYVKAHPLPDPTKDVDAARTAQIQIAAVNAAMSGTGDGR